MSKAHVKSKVSATYVAFLRGINVGGNGLIKMSDLKTHFEKTGCFNVRTYINSGNVIFQNSRMDGELLERKIERALALVYPFRPKVVVRDLKEMEHVNKNIPKSWVRGPEKKCNVLFLKRSVDSKGIVKGLNPKERIEEVVYYPGVLFWSALTSDLTKSSMIKLLANKLYQEVTVRNLNTTRKVFELMKQVSES